MDKAHLACPTNQGAFRMRHSTPATFLVILCCLLFLSADSQAQPAASSNHRTDILILHSYDPTYPWTRSIMEGITTTFQEARYVNLYVEYLDSKAGLTPEKTSRLEEAYRQKYATIDIDLVITSDNNALDFMLEEREALFPGIPIVFCGINKLDLPRIKQKPPIMGVIENSDIEKTLRLAHDIFPERRNVYVVSDNTVTGVAMRQTFERMQRKFEPYTRFTLLHNLSQPELRQKLITLGKDDLVLLLSYFRDAEGNSLSVHQMMDIFREDCQVPVFSMWDFMIDKGAFGGYAIQGKYQGREAARLALDYLAGQIDQKVMVERDSPNTYMFHYDRLREFGVSTRRLPEESHILHQPISRYREYKHIIWATAAFLFLQMTLIIFLYSALTLRRRALEALRESEDKYRNLFRMESNAIFLVERKTSSIIEANPKATKLYGYTREELLTMKITELIAHGDEQDSTLSETGSIQSMENHKRKNGEIFPAETTSREYTWRGTLVFAFTVRDISKRKRAEEARRRNQERYRALFQVSPSGILLRDQQDKILDCNPMMAHMLGRDRQEIVGKQYHQILNEKPDLIQKHTQSILNGKTLHHEFWIQRADHSICCMEIREVTVQQDDATTNILAIANDITQRRQVEDALKQSEARNRAFLKALPDFLLRLSSETILIDCHAPHPLPGIFPEHSQKYIGKKLEECPIPHALTRDLQKTLRKTLDSQKTQTREVMVQAVAQETATSAKPPHHHLEIRVAPCGKEEAVCVIRDITLLQHAQEETHEIQAQFLQAQKRQAIGVLASGIAHDFNNLLMGILGHATLALKNASPGTQTSEHLLQIEKNAEQATELTQQVLAYAAGEKTQTEKVDLSTLVEEMAHLLLISISKKTQLKTHLAPYLPPIEGNPTQLRQVVMNLILNSSDAIKDKQGTIEITTGLAKNKPEYLEHRLMQDAADPSPPCVFIEICDTGCGIAKEYYDQIFNPFYTTKGDLRGLGLSAVLGIIRNHAGAISMQSQPNQGSRFRIHFPAASSQPTTKGAPKAPQGKDTRAAFPGQKHYAILLVDDDPVVRNVTARMLEAENLKVFSAENGWDALQKIKQTTDRINAVLLDMNMPEMDGPETYEAIRSIRPSLPIILTSGRSRQESLARLEDAEEAVFVQKPYRIEELLTILQKLLQYQDHAPKQRQT